VEWNHEGEALSVHRRQDNEPDDDPEPAREEYEDNVDELQRIRRVIIQSEGKKVNAIAKKKRLATLLNELRIARRGQERNHDD
jgi:hypothetical protein